MFTTIEDDAKKAGLRITSVFGRTGKLVRTVFRNNDQPHIINHRYHQKNAPI